MRAALGFLTVLGGARTPNARALRWFPLVGAVVGAVVGSVWWLGNEAFSPLLAAALAVATDAALTGMLHLDGLADSADGLLPHADRERRLEIMRGSDVGAFGAVAIVLVLVSTVAALEARPADIGLIAALWCASRTVVCVIPAWLPYVREEGIASEFVQRSTARWPALALLPAGALAAVTAGGPGIAAVGAVVAGALGVLALGRSRIGGFTGDVLGAAIVVGQLAGLMIAAARW